MPAPWAFAFAAVSIALLCWSAVWTDRTYRRFDRLPGHYDVRGEATRMAPRRVMAWLLPVTFSIALIGLAAVLTYVPADMQNGDPTTGLALASITLLGAQGLILWLLSRWARRQG